MLCDRICLLVAQSTQAPESNLNSVTRGSNDSGIIIETVKNIVTGLGDWIATSLFNFICPIVMWGAKIVIAFSIVVYFCSRDKKSVSSAVKAFLIFLLFAFIQGMLE